MKVGARIQVGKDRATVRFIGPVHNSKGEWLGVEWDDPSRGKHDGTHQDTKYFDCRYPTSGSFIRFHPDKVQTGTSFINALKSKYLEEDDITRVREGEAYDKTKDHAEIYIGENKEIMVETVGFEKIQRQQRQLGNLKVVGLAEQLIASAGEKDEISNNKLTIEDLDLSRNLIPDWQTVFDIVSQLPHLTILRLNQLRLSSPLSTTNLQLSNIKTLSLNQTLISWKDVQVILTVFPQLQDLQLGGNELSVLGSVEHTQLKSINLEGNLISDWKQIAHLGSLPNLETLFLNDNQISTIENPSNESMFSKLKLLRIERNLIDNWNSLDALNHYKSLEQLRCKENPIFKDMDKELQEAQIVGRIKNLTTVNNITLTNRERTDLERYYLLQCIKDGKTHEAISSIHPRYKELCAKHGEPVLTQTKEASSTLKDRLINITLTIRDSIPPEDVRYHKDLPAIQKSISKKFLRTMTIRNVKNMIQRLLKIPFSNQQLFLLQTVTEKEDERDLMIMDITDDLRDLKFYGINDGDEILINRTC